MRRCWSGRPLAEDPQSHDTRRWSALGGDDGGATGVVTWLSGLPLRTGVHPDGLMLVHRYDGACWPITPSIRCCGAGFTADLPPRKPALPSSCSVIPGLPPPVSRTDGVHSMSRRASARRATCTARTAACVAAHPVYADTLPTVASVATSLAHRLMEATMTPRLRGGRVFDPANGINGQIADICVRDGRIVSEPDKRRSQPT